MSAASRVSGIAGVMSRLAEQEFRKFNP